MYLMDFVVKNEMIKIELFWLKKHLMIKMMKQNYNLIHTERKMDLF